MTQTTLQKTEQKYIDLLSKILLGNNFLHRKYVGRNFTHLFYRPGSVNSIYLRVEGNNFVVGRDESIFILDVSHGSKNIEKNFGIHEHQSINKALDRIEQLTNKKLKMVV